LLFFLCGVPFLAFVCFFEEVFLTAFFLDVEGFFGFLLGEGLEEGGFDKDQ